MIGYSVLIQENTPEQLLREFEPYFLAEAGSDDDSRYLLSLSVKYGDFVRLEIVRAENYGNPLKVSIPSRYVLAVIEIEKLP